MFASPSATASGTLVSERAIGRDQRQGHVDGEQGKQGGYRQVKVGPLRDGLRVIESGSARTTWSSSADCSTPVRERSSSRTLPSSGHGGDARRGLRGIEESRAARPRRTRRPPACFPASSSTVRFWPPCRRSSSRWPGWRRSTRLPVAQYPEITPPTVRVTCTYPGASAQVVADTVAAPIEQQVNGVEGMLYMSSQSSNDGTYQLERDVQGRHRPEHGAGAGAEPRRAGHAHAARRGQADRRDHHEAVARPDDDRQFVLAGRPVRPALPEQLRLDPNQGRDRASGRGRRGDHLRSARLQHARMARSRPAGHRAT